MEDVVNVLHITAKAEKYLDASFPKPAKRLMIDPLKIFITMIKRIDENSKRQDHYCITQNTNCTIIALSLSC